MKAQFLKYLLVLLMATSFIGVSLSANAYFCKWRHGYKICFKCKYVPGHWKHGYWVTPHKVCWRI